MFEDVNLAYKEKTKEWRNISYEIFDNNDFRHLKPRRHNSEKYRFSLLVRRRRHHSSYEDGREDGGLEIGRRELVVNIGGSFYSDRFNLGYNSPIKIKAGKELLKNLPYTSLTQLELNKIGGKYRKDLHENIHDFLLEIISTCDNYIGENKN